MGGDICGSRSIPCYASPSPPTETLAEVRSVQAALRSTEDIKVLPGKWSYSDAEEFPPLQTVLDTPLWSDPFFRDVRAALLCEVPNPEVVVGGEYMTVESRRRRRTTLPDDVAVIPGTVAEARAGATRPIAPC